MRKLTILIMLVAAAAVVFGQDNPPKNPSAQSDAKKAFAKLKTLSGSWRGKVHTDRLHDSRRIHWYCNSA